MRKQTARALLDEQDDQDEHDDLAKERLTSEVSSLRASLTTKETELATVVTRLNALEKWSEGVKAKAAIVLGILTFVGALMGSVLTKFIPG